MCLLFIIVRFYQTRMSSCAVWEEWPPAKFVRSRIYAKTNYYEISNCIHISAQIHNNPVISSSYCTRSNMKLCLPFHYVLLFIFSRLFINLPPSVLVIPLIWCRLSNMSSVVELVDLPLPNQPVDRSKFTARLLLFENRLSALLAQWLLPLFGVPSPATFCGFDRSRRQRKRPSIRSIRLDVVKVTNSSLLLWLFGFDAHASISPTWLISLSLLLLLFSLISKCSDLSRLTLFLFGDDGWRCCCCCCSPSIMIFAPIRRRLGNTGATFCTNDALWLPPLLLLLLLMQFVVVVPDAAAAIGVAACPNTLAADVDVTVAAAAAVIAAVAPVVPNAVSAVVRAPVNDAFCKLLLLFSNGDVFVAHNNDVLGLCVRLAQRLCLVSTFTCTSTPGRNGHLGGLFGISGGGGRGGGSVDVFADVPAPAGIVTELFVVCVDKTLISCAYFWDGCFV